MIALEKDFSPNQSEARPASLTEIQWRIFLAAATSLQEALEAIALRETPMLPLTEEVNVGEDFRGFAPYTKEELEQRYPLSRRLKYRLT